MQLHAPYNDLYFHSIWQLIRDKINIVKNDIFMDILVSMNDSYYTGPRSAVGNVSGYRCEADCRSRGREFDPGPVPYFRGD